MRIKSIEPTPSPNTMKVSLDFELPAGARNNYTKDNKEEAPEVIQKLFTIEGVKGLYHVADFLAIERNSKYDWKGILQGVRAAFCEEENVEASSTNIVHPYGEVKVLYQMYEGIPMQVKLSDGEQEYRFGLHPRFKEAIMNLQMSANNVVLDRKWVEQGTRYGIMEEIGQEVVEEVEAAYPVERINQIIQTIQFPEEEKQEKSHEAHVTIEMLEKSDWKKRYAILDRMEPTMQDAPVLIKALRDEKSSIRRLAVVYLGMLENEGVIPFLIDELHDKAVTVRRTAGDCLSDLGSSLALPAMIEALEDKSKLVRWRAAMFLYELGDETALSALHKAAEDEEFEVALQAKMAIARIEEGEEAKGSIWKQMTEMRK